MKNLNTIKAVLAGAACMSFFPMLAGNKKSQQQRPNILFIVADDLNCSSTPMFGCTVPDLMPNIERLSHEGMLFRRAHVASAASQVSRGGIMTGLYPHNSGIDGFYHTEREDIPTVPEIFRENGYKVGIISKVEHSTPKASIRWDMEITEPETHYGRDPEVYYSNTKKFIEQCRKEGKPFFFMANSMDPHRPWAGSDAEKQKWGNDKNFPDPDRFYKPEEVDVPGFVPDLPDIRKEAAQYYSSVRRLDQSVGAVLKALKESGAEDNTVVMFISDNGMSMPFSKTCSYLHSTHTPLVVKYPGVVKPDTEDDTHFVNGIDFMPTFFDIAGIKTPEGLDGTSFYPLLKGRRQRGRDYVYTEFTENSGRMREPMRAVQNAKYGYIYNAWSDGSRVFKSETMSGLTFNAMKKAAVTDPAIKERVELFLHRVPEEFYDYEKDPDALHNLIDVPEYQDIIRHFRRLMEDHLRATDDPVLTPFLNMYDKEAVGRYLDAQDELVRTREENGFYKSNKSGRKKERRAD